MIFWSVLAFLVWTVSVSLHTGSVYTLDVLAEGWNPLPIMSQGTMLFKGIERQVKAQGEFGDPEGRCVAGQFLRLFLLSTACTATVCCVQIYPEARGGHTMTSNGSQALMCGGYR